MAKCEINTVFKIKTFLQYSSHNRYLSYKKLQ